MHFETAEKIAYWARTVPFEAIDITGGAPELNPDIKKIVTLFSALTPQLIFRSNLSALAQTDQEELLLLLKSVNAAIVASFPSLNESQADSQRGMGIYKTSVNVLQKLNSHGFGRPGSGLVLNLVSNPAGAFLSPDQIQIEHRFRQVMKKKWGITFNHLFSFSNVPLGRFRRWLEKSGNLPTYLEKLADCFNPGAVAGVMCRSLVSIDWDGYLFDCDFNLSRKLPLGGETVHVSELKGPLSIGTPIATADHCFACTAGAGFT
jgi:radical SAM/Cys-rich protein